MDTASDRPASDRPDDRSDGGRTPADQHRGTQHTTTETASHQVPAEPDTDPHPGTAETAQHGHADDAEHDAESGHTAESGHDTARGHTAEPEHTTDHGHTAADDQSADHLDSAQSLSDPTLSELLAGSARGEQPSFATFYDATSDVVYGLALLMHADAQGAQDSTLAVYHQLWDQADERAQDLRLQSQASELLTDEHAAQEQVQEEAYRPSEYELVLEWLVPLAHRIIVERFREGLATPIPLTVVPAEQGGGIAGLPEEIIEDISVLSDSQSQALALSYLAGGTHQQVAAQVGSAVPAVKSRLRDGMTRMHARRTTLEAELDPILRAAVTKKDVERSGAVKRNFTEDISSDVENGLLVELAEVHALDAIDNRERAVLDEAALTADEATARAWDTRVLAARRTLAEIFTAYPVVPPSNLLDEVLHNLSDQEVGMGMVESISSHTEVTSKREPVMKRWMIVTGLGVVVLAAILLIWGFASGQDIQATADGDPEARVVEGVELTEGGTARAVISTAEGVGYVDFFEVGELEGDTTYQLWLMPRDEGQPSSLGNFTAAELEEEIVTLRDIEANRALQITIETIRGEERPTGETAGEIELRERVTDGPQYGGSVDEDQEED
ncbi:anti-sigma factor domain-containing protein [Nesterenkonia jeotgali]|uniref:DNA-directed RNA polymerase specialized sigma24 family protein n=1 Tax=Nesterenkonia jeotgali TaxID=317018 RepID=A0A839FUC9_9MICC|nr:anti-sigma factor [Nesterenkonia jeotgali]MBA8921463.1 DNA-directed RNA polymerase specialized sigma24 family protein [Nesterenkonia jeotgali]